VSPHMKSELRYVRSVRRANSVKFLAYSDIMSRRVQSGMPHDTDVVSAWHATYVGGLRDEYDRIRFTYSTKLSDALWSPRRGACIYDRI
jgi:hypothetical protein